MEGAHQPGRGGGAEHNWAAEDDEIFQEDTWEVVSAYFEDKGLVRQQLDSFNEFIGTTIQEVHQK